MTGRRELTDRAELGHDAPLGRPPPTIGTIASPELLSAIEHRRDRGNERGVVRYSLYLMDAG
jgi:hypothetical protein